MFLRTKNLTIKNILVFLSIIAFVFCFAPNTFAGRIHSLPKKLETRRNVPRTFKISLQQQTSRRKFWRKYICNMSDDSVKDQLNYEIARYINREPTVFKIDKNLIRESDPRAFLINLSTLNYLFDKYDSFTEQFIKFKNQAKHKPFLLTSESITSYDQMTLKDLSGFCLNNMDSYLKRKKNVEICIEKNKWLSKRNISNAYESNIVHEFGHLITCFYAINKHHIDISEINSMNDIKNINNVRLILNDFLNEAKQNQYNKKTKTTLYNNELKKIIREKFATSNQSGYQKVQEDLLNILQYLNPDRQQKYIAILRNFFNSLSSKSVLLSNVTTDEDLLIKSILTKSLDTNDKNQCPMGIYGNSSPSEFIAEAFAHLECSDSKNVSKLGKETEKFIIKEMKFLEESKSKFHKK